MKCFSNTNSPLLCYSNNNDIQFSVWIAKDVFYAMYSSILFDSKQLLVQFTKPIDDGYC